MITRNRTGKFSFLKYSVGVFAAIVITLLFACDRKTVDKKTSEPVTIVASTDNNTINSVPQDNGNAKEANSEKKKDSAGTKEDVIVAATNNNTNNSVPQKERYVMEVNSEKKMDSAEPEEEVFVIVEQPATFQGNDLNSFRDWVAKNLNYPSVAAEKGIQGKVYVQFVVNKDGNVKKVKVLRGVDPSLDKEAVRVVESSPVWEPARQGGRKVAQQFVIPIAFVLQ